MKKILIILISLLGSYTATHAQTPASVQKKIELANVKFVKWFNAGQADSIVAQYHPNACITGKGCGTTFLQGHFKSEIGNYKFREITTSGVTLDGKKAIERGHWRITLPNNVELSGNYESEWQLVNNRWMILKETVLE